MIQNYESEEMKNEKVVICFDVLSQHLPGEREENCEN
jgi:hypothetical protein